MESHLQRTVTNLVAFRRCLVALEALPSSASSVGPLVGTIIEPPSRVAPGMAVAVVVVVVVVVVVPLALHLGRWLACGHCGSLRGLRLAKLEKPAQIARRLRQFLRTVYSSGLVRQSALGSAGTNLTDVVPRLLNVLLAAPAVRPPPSSYGLLSGAETMHAVDAI
jgi:hypothetical protein